MEGYIVKHSHLGIGKVVSITGNTAKIRFLDGQEHPFGPSAFNNGSIKHAKLNIGDRCVGTNGECQVNRIISIPPRDAAIQYEVKYTDGLSAVLTEIELTPLPTSRTQDPLQQFASLAPESYNLFRSREQLVDAFTRTLREGSGLRALLSSRIDLRPHQAYVAGVVLLDISRRYVLADEVGLGKTIEAGVIIHDLLTQKPDARVLILCPGALTQQWLSEIYSKFGGQVFNLLDLHAGRAIRWQDLRKVIASTTLAAYDAAEQLKAIKWDMLIVDEAHHMLGSPVLLDFVQQLSQAVPSLLLLSAIPAQRREDDFLRLLGLLEPGRYQSDSKEEQEKFRILYAAQSDIGRRLRRLTRRVEALASGESTPDDVIGLARRLLDLPSLEDDAQLGSMIDSLDSSTGTLTEEARSIIHHVADRHRVNRRILRNRRTRLIEEGQLQPIQRKFKPHPYQPEQLEIELTGAVETILRTLQDKRVVAELLIPFTRVITHSTVLPSTAEAFLERLSGAETGKLNSKGLDFLAMGYMFGYEDWEDYADLVCMGIRPFLSDELVERAFESAKTWRRSKRGTARFERLTNFLNSKQQENPLPKLLVFAGFPEATEEVAKLLRIEFGNSAVKEFRHDLSQDEKEQNVRQFQATPKTWILVSDETGGEGRNFQFASELIHFDNPWYASRVEQRIGRLDRLGRERVRNDVVSNVIFSEGSIEDGLVRSYHSGLKVYDESISGLEFALRDVEQRIVEVALEGGYDALVDNVLELGKMAEQERAQDESEAVLDEASFELKAAERFRRVSQSPDGEKELEESFVNYFRTISSPKSAKEWHEPAWPVGVWKFSADNTLVQLPTLNKNQAGLVGEFKGTFRREIAQQRPELGFFNVGNPFFDGVIETLWQQPTARTYAVACTSAQHEGWTGLEFAFYAKPDLKMLEGNYGLANQATSLFTTKPIHLFFTTEGVYDAGGDVLLAIRQQLTKDLKGRTWWNLTKEKAQLPSQSLGGRDWQDTVQDIYKIARDTARQLFAERFGGVIEAETKRIAEQCRQLRQQGDDLSQRDIIPLQVLALSIENWSVELDSLGFLSVNEINVR